MTLGVAVAWSVLAIVLATLAYRRRSAGRVGLLICAGAAGGLCLAGTVGAPLLLIPTIACVATVLLLARADVRAWFTPRPPVP